MWGKADAGPTPLRELLVIPQGNYTYILRVSSIKRLHVEAMMGLVITPVSATDGK